MIPQKKSVAMVIILSIITCGIYYYVWLYQTSNEVQQYSRGYNNDASDMSPGIEVVLSLVTCGIYNIYWQYKYSKKIYELSCRSNFPAPADNSIVCLILALFGFSMVSAAILQDQLNKNWDFIYYNNGNNSNGYSM